MSEESRRKQFFEMYLTAERSIQRFLQLLVHDRNIFEDICQSVALRLWERYDSYDPQRPFDTWARGVAVNVVNELRRSESRMTRCLPPEAVQAIADAYERHGREAADLAEQLQTLKGCLDGLPKQSQEIIVAKYYQSIPIEKLATLSSRSLPATYKALERALGRLADCLQKRLSQSR